MNVVLERFAYLRRATLGWLSAGELRVATIERPWIADPDGPGGQLRESCVPDGLYKVRPHSSEKFPETYALVNEQRGVYYQPGDIPPGQRFGRSAILIHIGNTVSDVVGCIAVGLSHDDSALMVSDSRIAMNKLRAALGRERHILQIRPIGTREIAA